MSTRGPADAIDDLRNGADREERSRSTCHRPEADSGEGLRAHSLWPAPVGPVGGTPSPTFFESAWPVQVCLATSPGGFAYLRRIRRSQANVKPGSSLTSMEHRGPEALASRRSPVSRGAVPTGPPSCGYAVRDVTVKGACRCASARPSSARSPTCSPPVLGDSLDRGAGGPVRGAHPGVVTRPRGRVPSGVTW